MRQTAAPRSRPCENPMSMKSALAVLLVTAPVSAQTWVNQNSGTTAALRGISLVNRNVAWASGTEGTWLRTSDGGGHWQSAHVPGARALDFRGLHAFDARIAVLMSSGPGDKSAVYKTVDGG